MPRPRQAVIAAVLSLLASLGLALVPTAAQAATTYSLKASGVTVVSVGGSSTLTATFLKNGVRVASASVSLQYRKGTSWVTARSVAVKNGKGSTTVKPPTAGRAYRFWAPSKAVSNAVTVSTVKLSASGSGTVTTGSSRTLTVGFVKNGVSASGTVALQYRSGSSWKTARNVTVTKGKGTTSVSLASTDRAFRFLAYGRVASPALVVRVVPATFTVTGSGSGHGAGMSQYGAYALAKKGKTAAQILSTYYRGTYVDSKTPNPSIANPTSSLIGVQVYGYPTDTGTSTTVTFPAGFKLFNKAGTLLAGYGSAGKVVVGVSGTKVTAKVTLADGTVQDLALAAQDYIRFTWTNTGTAAVSVSGAQGTYRYGDLRVTVIKARPNVVNFVIPNSEYLYGIDEMPASWSPEALKAQAIAARTYAIRKLSADKANTAWPDDVDPACGCNVFDDTRSQNYTGWKKAGATANAPWVSAVNATRDDAARTVQALRPSATSAGVFAETPYFASTGKGTGWGTANNHDVWGTTQLPYLASVADTWTFATGAPANPYLSWSRSLTQAQVKGLFGLSDVKSVTVAARYPGGLVKTLTAKTATGTAKSISKTSEAWRSALGVKSPWVVSITGK